MKKYLQRSLLQAPIAVSGANTYKSLWQPIDMFNQYMIQVVWTGTPSAILSVIVSADPVPSLETYNPLTSAAPRYYDNITNSITQVSAIPLSASGDYIVTYEIYTSSANWAAVQWVNAGGSTATITAINFIGKGALV